MQAAKNKDRKHPKIPTFPYYVTATDTFMSGWGQSEGLTNRLIFPCESMKEAKLVVKNAKSRTDMSRVRICHRAPRARKGIFYQVMNRELCIRWYRKGWDEQDESLHIGTKISQA